jgi:hypothetical protein
MARQIANIDWSVVDKDGNITWERVTIAVLMDIRAELQKLNRVMQCHNTQDIPTILRGIRRNTTKPKRKKK